MPLLKLADKDINRLMAKIIKGPGEDDCWNWADIPSKDGYAYLGIGGRGGRKYLVHRLLYELIIGPIPDGKELDHLCRNRLCVRPDHQEPVTRRVNLLGEIPLPHAMRLQLIVRTGIPMMKLIRVGIRSIVNVGDAVFWDAPAASR